jgi:hypothetical protein
MKTEEPADEEERGEMMVGLGEFIVKHPFGFFCGGLLLLALAVLVVIFGR